MFCIQLISDMFVVLFAIGHGVIHAEDRCIEFRIHSLQRYLDIGGILPVRHLCPEDQSRVNVAGSTREIVDRKETLLIFGASIHKKGVTVTGREFYIREPKHLAEAGFHFLPLGHLGIFHNIASKALPAGLQRDHSIGRRRP